MYYTTVAGITRIVYKLISIPIGRYISDQEWYVRKSRLIQTHPIRKTSSTAVDRALSCLSAPKDRRIIWRKKEISKGEKTIEGKKKQWRKKKKNEGTKMKLWDRKITQNSCFQAWCDNSIAPSTMGCVVFFRVALQISTGLKATKSLHSCRVCQTYT